MKFLLFSILVCLTALAFTDVIVDEGFEGGVVPPTGWIVWELGESGCSEWDITILSPHTGEYCAYHSDSWSEISQSWLVTDTYDMSTYDLVAYSFWRDLDYADWYNYTGFFYSTVASPEPADFIELLELGNDVYVWEEFLGDITAECAGQATVTFAWVYVGGYEHAERIDDVLIEGFSVAIERDTWGAIKSTY